MTPIPQYAKAQDPTPVEMAIFTAEAPESTWLELKVALAVLLDQGDPPNPEHRRVTFALNRHIGRWYGHRALPARWEVK